MMGPEALLALKNEVKCRDDQIDLLNSFISNDAAINVPSLIVHGQKSIGKTYTVEKFLSSLGIRKTVIRCDECVTKKLLLQRCLRMIRNDSGVDLTKYNQIFNYKGILVTNFGKLCETFTNFAISLEQFFEETNYEEPHVLVLDRFDECIDSINDVFLGFLRLQEFSKIKNMTIVFIMSGDDPKEVITNMVPHVFFPQYSQEQVVDILQSNALCLLPSVDLNTDSHNNFWKQYAKMIVDSYFPYTGSDMNLLVELCYKLWPHFTGPIKSGLYKSSDFIKIFRDKRELLTDSSILNSSNIVSYDDTKSLLGTNTVADLTVHSKFLLIASYLASHVEPKYDLQVFSRVKVGTKKRRSNKKGDVSKAAMTSRLLTTNYFDLERLLAILSVIYRNESEFLNGDLDDVRLLYNKSERDIALKNHEISIFSINSNIDINCQIATLVSLGLLVRTSTLDILSAKVRWKCNISWETALNISKELNFPLHHYFPQ